MEARIKEEARETSLCFETSGDNLADLSLVEKYDRFIQNDSSDIYDSDGDFFPDDTILKREYAQLTSGASGYPRAKNHRLSTGLPVRFRSLPLSNSDSLQSKDTGNGTSETSKGGTPVKQEHDETGEEAMSGFKSELNCINELIDRLAEVRRAGQDGNSIFCDEKELEAIQERYGAILDYVHEKASTFERRSSSKDSENEEQVDVGNPTPAEHRESAKLLAEKIALVQQARDRFYEVEQLVREQVEQLELVERYKMESVG